MESLRRYFFAVIGLLWVLRGVYWVLVQGIRMLERPWKAFHNWRLGDDEFRSRAFRRWCFSYVIEQRKRENIDSDLWPLSRLRWELWAVFMRLSGLCYTAIYDGLMFEEGEKRHAQGKRERSERAERLRRKQKRQREMKIRTASDYDGALLLFDLRQGYTHKDFSKAYREAIMAAHPDMGGTKEDAQAINIAHDLIKRHNGW